MRTRRPRTRRQELSGGGQVFLAECGSEAGVADASPVLTAEVALPSYFRKTNLQQCGHGTVLPFSSCR